MPRDAATGYQSGGGGVGYEREIAALYLLAMLEARPILNDDAGSTIGSVSFQVRGAGWLTDDLLLHLDNERASRVVISVKSGDLLSGSNWTETRSDAYEMLRAGAPFVANRDMILIETSYLGSDGLSHLRTLLNLASVNDADDLHRRITTGDPTIPEKTRRFYSSSCGLPPSLAAASDPVPAVFLKHSILRVRDIRGVQSEDRNDGVHRCADVLSDQSAAAVQNLWNALVAIANELTPNQGCLTRAQLIQRLLPNHNLRDRPDVRRSTERLQAWSSERRQMVKTTLGGSFVISRSNLEARLGHLMSQHMLTVVIGPSGTGKTVAVINAAQAVQREILFIGASDLRSREWSALVTSLDHPLDRLLRLMPFRACAVIIDGCELLDQPEHLQALARLVGTIERVAIERDIVIVMTSQAQHAEVLTDVLTRSGRSIGYEQVRPLTVEELNTVASQFSELRQSNGARLSDVFLNIKLLDIVITNLELADQALFQALSEVDVYDWYWRRIIGRLSIPCKSALMKLARTLADSGIRQIALADTVPEVAQVANELQQAGVCQVDAYGVVRMTHDITSDWVQLSDVIAQLDRAGEFMDGRLLMVRWRPTIRLWIQREIERTPDVATMLRWMQRGDVWFVLAVEALISAKSVHAILTNAWPGLIVGEGESLRKLLTQFVQYATIADPRFSVLTSGSGASAIQLRAALRVPLEAYWEPIVAILEADIETAMMCVADNIAGLCSIWLSATPVAHPLSARVARLALAVGRHGWSAHATRLYRGRPDQQKCYRALFAAYQHLPAETASVLRLAACRRLPEVGDPNIQLTFYRPPGSITRVSAGIMSRRERMSPPWADGPLHRTDEKFRNLLIENKGLILVPIMRAEPGLAAELILASFIEEPQPVNLDSFEERMREPERAGLESFFGFLDDHPSMSLWSTFFLLQPEVALETVIRLVDFNTSRALAAFNRTTEPSPDDKIVVLVGGVRVAMLGRARMLTWYHGHWAHLLVVMALMALERYCYTALEAGRDLAQVFSRLLMPGRSAAFLGILWVIAKFKPALLEGPLQPLISCWELHDLEPQMAGRGTGAYFPLRFTERVQSVAGPWNAMPHRRLQLQEHIFLLCATRQLPPEFLRDVRELWRSFEVEAPADDNELGIELDIARMDENNYRLVQRDDVDGYVFVPPDDLRRRMDRIDRIASNNLRVAGTASGCLRLLTSTDAAPSADVLLAEIRDLHDLQLAAPAAAPHDLDEVREQMRDAALVGCAALIYARHGSWCSDEAHAGDLRQVFVLAKLAIRRSEMRRNAESNFSHSEMDTEAMASKLAAILAAGSSTKKQGLRLMAHLCQVRRDGTKADVFAAAWNKRTQLGEDLWRLVAFLIALSVNHDASSRMERVFRFEAEDASRVMQARDHLESATEGLRRALDGFVGGTLATDIALTWADTAIANGRLVNAGPARGIRVPTREGTARTDDPDRWRRELAVSTYMLAEACVPSMSLLQVDDPAERLRWRSFLGQALKAVLAECELYNERGEPLSLAAQTNLTTPYEYQLKIVMACGVESILTENGAHFDAWWAAVLGNGARLQHVLEYWFLSVLPLPEAPGDRANGAQRWGFMVDGLSLAEGTRFPLYGQEMFKIWRAALGFSDDASRSAWTTETVPILRTKELILKNFFLSCMADGDESKWAFRFAQHDSGKPFRAIILQCALEARNRWNAWWFRDGAVDDLAQLLVLYFTEDLAGRADMLPTRIQYLALIAVLSGQQHPLAATLLEMTQVRTS